MKNFKKSALFLVTLLAGAFCSAHAGVLLESDTTRQFDGYIVVFHSGHINQKDRKSYFSQVAADLSAKHHTTPFSENYGGIVDWFAARMTREQAKVMANDPRVELIEPNYILKGGARQPNPPFWGLDYIDSLVPDILFKYPTNPVEDVKQHIYVLDSGIANHPDFGNRIIKSKDFIANPNSRIHWHGTHVAGIAAGTIYGVAKNAKIISVRVSDTSNYSSNESLNNAMQWIIDDIFLNPLAKGIVNLSIEDTGHNTVLDRLISDAINYRQLITVAIAGHGYLNYPDNACALNSNNQMRFPKDAVKVGSIDRNGLRQYGSNYGSCLDFYAPGVDIFSANAYYFDTPQVASGTSVAAPFVTGALALVRAKYPNLDARQAIDLLKTQSRNSGRIVQDGVPALYTGFLGEIDIPAPPPPPPAPTGLTAISLACWGQSQVTWQPSAGATSYQLFHNTQMVSSNAQIGMDTTVYNTSTVLRVRACNAGGCSGDSSPVLAPYVRYCGQ